MQKNIQKSFIIILLFKMSQERSRDTNLESISLDICTKSKIVLIEGSEDFFIWCVEMLCNWTPLHYFSWMQRGCRWGFNQFDLSIAIRYIIMLKLIHPSILILFKIINQVYLYYYLGWFGVSFYIHSRKGAYSRLNRDWLVKIN